MASLHDCRDSSIAFVAAGSHRLLISITAAVLLMAQPALPQTQPQAAQSPEPKPSSSAPSQPAPSPVSPETSSAATAPNPASASQPAPASANPPAKALASQPADASALPAAPDLTAEAAALFARAKKLMRAGKHAAACPLLADAMAKAPGAGILYYLATCRAKLGQNARAYRLYQRLADTMKRQGKAERARIAQQRADEIERRLIFMRIAVSELIIGLVIKRNGQRITAADFAGAPIAPGRYTIEATAPGMRPFSTVVEARRPGTTLIVTIPQLDDPDPPEPVVIVKTRHLRVPVESDRPQRIAAWVLGGVAAAGAVTGAVTLALAIDKRDAAAPHCPLPDACYTPGAELIDEARTLGTIATVGFVAAGVLGGGAVTLGLTAPDDDALNEVPAVGVVFGPTAAALRIQW